MPFPIATVPAWNPAVHVAPGALSDWDAELFARRVRAGYEAPAVANGPVEPLLVTGRLFATVSATRGLLPQSVHIFPRLHWTQAFDGIGRTLTLANHAGLAALVGAHAGYPNYYHWTLQCVAALLVERRQGQSGTPLVVPTLSAGQRALLDLFGIDGPFVEVPPDAALAIDRAFVSNLASGDYAFAPHPEVLDLFRTRGAALAPAPVRQRRLYLSRAGRTANRPLRNEAELIALLGGHGFEIVSPGDLTLAEQIALVREAALIVAPHGAALTNLAWTDDGDAGPQVVELMQADYLNRCFAKLAQAKRLAYSVVVNPKVGEAAHHHLSAWTADLALLTRVLGL